MKVLYATDGFDAAEQAALLTARIADPDRVDVTVISVNPRGLPSLEHAVLMLDPPELRREDTLGLVDYWVEWFRDRGFTATGRLGEGRPGEEIVRAVEDGWFDLTVLGSGHHSWLGGKLLGSVSNHVLHTSPTGVLIVHETRSADDVRLLVAADGSRCCEFAGRSARELVRPTGTLVKVISCYSPVITYAAPGSVAVIPDPSGPEHEHAKRSAERTAEHTATEFRDSGFEAEATSIWGHPTEQILKEAESWRADLVVMGSRGQGPVKRALLGSVSDAVVRHAAATLVGRHIA